MQKSITFASLSEHEEAVGKEIVDAAFKVHSKLGPGLLERVYEICFCYELQKRGLKVERQVPVPVVYDELVFDEGFRADVVVEDLVLVELKAVLELHPVHKAQTLSHMELLHKRLGYLINFHVVRIKDGIHRCIR